ncbi:AAC-rich mRNA clone AAC4 protein [Lingula anatina]|uniref:AAC-rich mRNA clone AAC4 protein n=1 Tax=Lingula anatina TaxID=7574 RepID=A0A1S3HXL8_LINAN|nr:AAC-rich mRNA clone AAC4 protein [Lingula anatina]|eukprot:XP_013390306.1 AAC-rich mRNA clone AAC4 protein [Lingula anatina]
MTIVRDNKAHGVFQCEFRPMLQMDKMALSEQAIKIRDVPNAGGNSVVSEVLSYEMMKSCFGATLLKTEMEVEYFPEGGSITDYTCSMFGSTLGVSVTRAMNFRGEFTHEDAIRLLNKKLKGILQSSNNTMETWAKQILHVWATSNHVANVLIRAYDVIDEHVKSNTVVLVTVAHQAEEIFANK